MLSLDIKHHATAGTQQGYRVTLEIIFAIAASYNGALMVSSFLEAPAAIGLIPDYNQTAICCAIHTEKKTA
jgi:hypothetical protein